KLRQGKAFLHGEQRILLAAKPPRPLRNGQVRAPQHGVIHVSNCAERATRETQALLRLSLRLITIRKLPVTAATTLLLRRSSVVKVELEPNVALCVAILAKTG